MWGTRTCIIILEPGRRIIESVFAFLGSLFRGLE